MKKTVLVILISVMLVAAALLAITFIPKAVDDRSLTVGVVDTSAVISYQNSDGKWDGINCAVIEQIAAEIGYTVEFKEISWSHRDTLLKNGDIDCYIGDSAILSDKNISTDVFVYSIQTLIYKDVFAVDNIDSQTIKNYPCAVQIDSFNYNYLLSSGSKNIKKYNSQPDIITAIKNDTCSVGIIDYGIYLSVIENNPEYKNITSGILTDNCGYRLIFRSKDSSRAQKINKGISGLKTNGVIKQITDRYDINSQQPFIIY